MENLGIDTKLIIAQLINFAVFFLIFYKFISKPFFQYLNDQKKQEEDRQKLLNELQNGESILKDRESELVKKMKKEAADVLEKAKKDAETVKQQIVADANKQASQIVEKSKQQLEEERAVLYKDLKKQIAEVSNIVVTKALDSYLSDEAKKEVTKRVLTNLPVTN